MKHQAALVGSRYALLFWVSVKYLTPVPFAFRLLISEIEIIPCMQFSCTSPSYSGTMSLFAKLIFAQHTLLISNGNGLEESTKFYVRQQRTEFLLYSLLILSNFLKLSQSYFLEGKMGMIISILCQLQDLVNYNHNHNLNHMIIIMKRRKKKQQLLKRKEQQQ